MVRYLINRIVFLGKLLSVWLVFMTKIEHFLKTSFLNQSGIRWGKQPLNVSLFSSKMFQNWCIKPVVYLCIKNTHFKVHYMKSTKQYDICFSMKKDPFFDLFFEVTLSKTPQQTCLVDFCPLFKLRLFQ